MNHGLSVNACHTSTHTVVIHVKEWQIQIKIRLYSSFMLDRRFNHDLVIVNPQGNDPL